MRKDLKIGLAIGAVLLVVLIVYMAVPKDAQPGRQGAELAQGDTPTDPVAADAQPDEQAGGAGQLADDASPRTEVAGAGSAAGTAAQPSADAEDPFKKDARTADATPADASSDGSASKGTNWAKLLETGELPYRSITPSLSASANTGGTPAATETGGVGEAAPAAAKVTDASATPAAAPTSAPTAPPPSATTVLPEPAAPKPAKPAVATGARTHKIERGETFSSIAKALYGDDRHYIAIQNANPDIDPARLKPGMTINLPDPASVKPARSGGSAEDRAMTAAGRQERDLDPSKEYRVKPADNLHDIAKRIYHAANMSDEIYELNKETIGDNPAKLKVGMILKLPAKPTTEPSAAAR